MRIPISTKLIVVTISFLVVATGRTPAAPAVLEIESLRPLEGELLSFYVDDALAVIGVPSDKWGEQVHALVVTRADGAFDDEHEKKNHADLQGGCRCD